MLKVRYIQERTIQQKRNRTRWFWKSAELPGGKLFQKLEKATESVGYRNDCVTILHLGKTPERSKGEYSV